jgi:hypothetical protein
MEFEPEGLAEAAGAALGLVGGRVNGDLHRFKEYIEEQGHETGAWRGNIDAPPQTPKPHPPPAPEHDPAVDEVRPTFPGLPGPTTPWLQP